MTGRGLRGRSSWGGGRFPPRCVGGAPGARPALPAGSRHALRGWAGRPRPIPVTSQDIPILFSRSPARVCPPRHPSPLPQAMCRCPHPHPFPTTSPPLRFRFPRAYSNPQSCLPPQFPCPPSPSPCVPILFLTTPQHHSSLCVLPSAPPYVPLPMLSPTAPLYHSSLSRSQSLYPHVPSPDIVSDRVSHVQEPGGRALPLPSPPCLTCPSSQLKAAIATIPF